MRRNFSELQKYAQRSYEFVQHDSMRLITQADSNANLASNIAGGVCFAVTVKWIKEKLVTSNSYIKPDGRFRGDTPRQFSNSMLGKVVASNPYLKNSNTRNEITMRQAADLQTSYYNNGLDAAIEEVDLTQVIYPPRLVRQEFGERPDRVKMIDDSEDSGYLADMRGYEVSPYLLADSIAKTVVVLPAGTAILILVNGSNGRGHAVAFYRSRQGALHLGGRTLYFFDGNAGTYRISNNSEMNIKRFIKAWSGIYENHISPVTFRLAGINSFVAFRRSGT